MLKRLTIDAIAVGLNLAVDLVGYVAEVTAEYAANYAETARWVAVCTRVTP